MKLCKLGVALEQEDNAGWFLVVKMDRDSSTDPACAKYLQEFQLSGDPNFKLRQLSQLWRLRL